ncbi:uncharacterized protein LOC111696141 [Eurytemora carolleeae]|uniref:uncharacterized protein LOC111696141 n=1 Tax=Eurytemora carolleeae TaxID=1294199 RepID=UPI000C78A120|nr:uncharacterized protein LOC111696141 [Eurytemora carolleeae]|eukprot:XP_023321464.1 uncharacterized protein LOC111696141 [Eurytemora affinis]
MSAAAALQKWLELKNKTSTPIFSATSILENEKMDSTSEGIWSEKIPEIFILSFLYILVQGLVFLTNWYSKYQYFKTKKSSSSTTHALYYSWFYCTASEAVEMSDIYQSCTDPEAPKIFSSTPRCRDIEMSTIQRVLSEDHGYSSATRHTF